MSSTFERIYQGHEWGGRSRSGPGSDAEATARLAYHLPRLIALMGARSVLDAGCGDGAWMPELPGYIGMDVARAAIVDARKAHPGRRYEVADLSVDPLPQVDVVTCRDVLMHLPLHVASITLDRLRAVCKWLIATTFERGGNHDVTTGGFYMIDLEAEPFHLGSPLSVLPDDWRYPAKALGVWRGTA